MDDAIFNMTRRFEHPPALVWRVWTEPDLVNDWYGPGVETEVHQFDLRPGGLWLHEMRMAGQSMYQRMEYVEVEAPSKLVLLMATTDDNWRVIANPMMPGWPLALKTTILLEPDGDGTVQTLIAEPHGATEEETAVFAAAIGQLEQGWGMGMDMVDGILEKLAT